MTKMLILDFEKCAGCRLCEVVCSVKHTGRSNPARANVHVVRWDEEGFFLPMRCLQCEVPACEAVCPRKAIHQDEELGRVVVNYDLCIGCKSCIIACPFGAMGFDIALKKVIKCDMCEGNPLCVKFCPFGAIEYVDADTVNFNKMRDAALKFADSITKVRHDKEERDRAVFKKHV